MIRRSQKYEHRLHYLHGRMKVVVLFMTVLLLVSCPVAFVYIHEEADRIPPTTVGNTSESTQAPVWWIRYDGRDWHKAPQDADPYPKPLEIIARSETTGARIQYSIGDGPGNVVLPTSTSLEFTEGSDPIKLAGSQITRTYTAYAWAPLRTASAYTTIVFSTGTLRTGNPGFRPAGGQYTGPQTLELLSEPGTEDALYYEFTTTDTNMDGNIDEADVTVDPTTASTQYDGRGIPILEEAGTYCIKVVALRGPTWAISSVSSACYVRGTTALTFSPVLDSYTTAQTLALRSFAEDDVLYYEFATMNRAGDEDRRINLDDVAEPTTDSPQYTGEVIDILVDDGPPIYCIKVLAVGAGSATKEGCYYRSFARVTALDFTLAADNDAPDGIWSDGNTMWVVDGASDAGKIYAYRMSDGIRDETKEFSLDGDNLNPTSLYSDGTTMWVDDKGQVTVAGELRNKIFAYNLLNGARRSTQDITFNVPYKRSLGQAIRIAANDNSLWVVNFAMFGTDHSVANAYALDTGLHDMGSDITLLDNTRAVVRDIWVNNDTMWVLDQVGIIVYKLSNGMHEESKDFDNNNGNIEFPITARGIWSDGTTMWVSDATSDQIRAYNMPSLLQ